METEKEIQPKEKLFLVIISERPVLNDKKYWRIGFTTLPQKYKSNLQQGNPRDLDMNFIELENVELENIENLKELLKENIGEWFKGTFEQFKIALENYKFICENPEIWIDNWKNAIESENKSFGYENTYVPKNLQETFLFGMTYFIKFMFQEYKIPKIHQQILILEKSYQIHQ